MPLARASPPPQSLPSDILGFLPLTCSASSSKDCAVTAPNRLRDFSDSESEVEQVHREGRALWRKAPITMDISPWTYQALKLKQPALSCNSPTSSGIWENLHPIKLKWIYETDVSSHKLTIKPTVYTERDFQRLPNYLRNCRSSSSTTPKFLLSSLSQHLPHRGKQSNVKTHV